MRSNISYAADTGYMIGKLRLKHYPSIGEEYGSYEEYERGAHYRQHPECKRS